MSSLDFECNETEFKAFERFIEKHGLFNPSGKDILLVLLGFKPGYTGNFSDLILRNVEMFKDMGFVIKNVEIDFNGFGDNSAVFLARDKERLSMLEERYEEDDEKEYRHDMGIFCGYPEESVEWFVEERDCSIEDAAAEFERSDFETLEFSLVSYIPKPEKESVENAKTQSRKYQKKVEQADNQFKSEIGSKLLRYCENR